MSNDFREKIRNMFFRSFGKSQPFTSPTQIEEPSKEVDRGLATISLTHDNKNGEFGTIKRVQPRYMNLKYSRTSQKNPVRGSLRFARENEWVYISIPRWSIENHLIGFIVWISIEGLPINAWTTNTFSKFALMWGDLVTPKFLGDNLDSSSFDDESIDYNENTKEDIKVDRISKSNCMRKNVSNIHCEETIQSWDPFNIYELLAKKKDNVPQSKDSDPTFPSVFTPNLANNDMDKGPYATPKQGNCTLIKEHVIRRNKDSPLQQSTNMAIIGGSILEVMDDLVKEGETVILGDFNEVQTEQERFGSMFNVQGANVFNNFIAMTKLIGLPLRGYSYTLAHKSATKMSKLDRFLISKGLLALFPYLTGLCLDRHLSYHRPILKKFQLLKYTIKNWSKENKTKLNVIKLAVQDKLSEVDKILDQSGGNANLLNHRSSLLKDLQDINSIKVLELSQKAKLAIRGILVDGEWIVDPSKVKYEFLNHFTKQFLKPQTPQISIGFQFPSRLQSPDGYSFEFFRKFWNLIDQEVVATVSEFFASGKFPPGCNSSFIALIHKIQDAKVVKDYRPISLIGSMYKIITKILANRLSLVMPDIISDVQSVFISNRQILNGPFILNELLSWCKYKKVNSMIFNVDFEKAFDSSRWDYLNDVLNSFDFGEKLLMESFHLSFNRVLDAGIYKGISISNSLTISHLFYADDAVFIDSSRLYTVLHEFLTTASLPIEALFGLT
ncbi:RNA-directed DNA polymerase, eukaryota [Tanacetum coccineum]|uniref:RNA-directed DNA polymerase, eukaryota n=1 Tax=Tanacetum coccineum TaxID=301880 RepID=A0ABQ4ZVI4_9ASTR